eukprot:2319289-Rhodomonas_salina.1
MDFSEGMQAWELWTYCRLWTTTSEEMGKIDLSAISSNLGPVGFWNSITVIRELLSYSPGILFLQDLCIPIHARDKVKSWLSLLFPQYLNVISVHTERLRKPDGRKA